MTKKLSKFGAENLPRKLLCEDTGQMTIGSAANKVKTATITTANIDTGTVTTLSTAAATLSGTTVISGTTTITGDHTVAATSIILCNATGGAIALTLPASALKRLLFIKKVALDSSTNAITITPATGNIDNAATNNAVDAAGDMMIIASDGTNWHILAQKLA